MSQTLKTSLIIDLAGNLQGKSGQFLNSMKRLGTEGSRSMNMLQKSVAAAGKGLDRLGNRYTALLSGGGLVASIKQVGDLSMRMTMLGINADTAATIVERLKTKVFQVAQMKDIRVDPSGIFSGVEKIVERLGDWQLAESQIRNIGLAMRATGADGEAVGAIIADLSQKLKFKPDDMLQALTIIQQAGKSGSFEMKDFVTQGPRVAAAMSKTGRTGVQGLKEMMAVMQVFRSATGSPEEATTAFKNFFNDLTESHKQAILQKNNIQIFEPDSLKKGKYKWRSPLDIMDDIIKKSHGDPRKYGQLLGMQTRDGFDAVMAEWMNSGTNPMHKFMEVKDDPKLLLDDAARAANEFNAAMTNINTAVKQFANTRLLGPVKAVADTLNSLSLDTVQRWLKLGAGFAGLMGGLVVLNTVASAFKNIRSIFGGGGGGFAPGAGIPVTVTNMPLGGINPATGMRMPPVVATSSGLGWAATPAIGTAVVGTASIAIGKALSKAEAKRTSTRELQNILSRQMVEGGGVHSYQARLIADELSRRGVNDVSGTIKLVIDNNSVRMDMLSSHSTNPKVRFDVDTGLMVAHK